jgi:hypothetical protein
LIHLHLVVVGRLASTRTETTLTGRSRTILFISANSGHCLGYAGRRYITTRFSTSFGTKRNSLRNHSPCRWGRRLCLVKCMHMLAGKVLQAHKSMPSVSTTARNCHPLATLIDDLVCLVGGPDRPIPQPKDDTPSPPGSSQSYTDRANVAKDSLANGANDLYSRLGSAVNERGQMLDGLEDTVNSLRTGSENMLAQVSYCRVPTLSSHLLTTRIGEETCCRAVDAGMVQLLTFSMH